MDPAKYENRTQEDLIAEIESLRAELAELRPGGQKHSREAQPAAAQDLRQLAHHFRCCLWQGTVTGMPGWDTAAGLDPDRRLFRWDCALRDIESARSVIDLEPRPGESYDAAWLRSRLQEDHRRMGIVATQALQRGERSYQQEFRCRDRHGQVQWLYESVTIQPLGAGHWQVFGVVVNITEHMQAEEALHQSEQQFRSLVETTSDWIWKVDVEGHYTYASPKVRDLLGYEPQEVHGRTPFDFMPPEESERVKQLFEATAASGRPIKGLENVNVRKDGQAVVLETSGEPIMDAVGNLLGYQGIDRDITERKRAEEDLRESERFARSTLDGLSAHIAIVNEKGVIEAANKAWREFAVANGGAAEKVCEGTDYLGICERACGEHSEGAARFVQVVHQVLAGRQSSFEMEYPCHSPEEQRWFTARVTRFPGNGPARAVIAHENITERKRAEEALADEKQFVEVLFASLPGNIFVFDRNGRRIRWNDYCITVLGWSEDDLRELGICDMVALRDRQRCELAFREALLNGHAEVELVGLAKDGRELPFFFNVVRAELAGEPYVVAVGIDISDRKQAEQQLQEFNATLEKRVDERTAELRHREREYRTLFEGVPVGVYRTTFDGRILQTNPALLEMLGFAGSDALEWNTVDRYVNPDDRRRWVQRMEAEGTVRDFEVQLRRTDGSVVWTSNTATIVRDDGGQVLYIEGSLTDITERKRAQAVAELYSQRVRHLAVRLSLAEEQERRRLAAVLHDDLVQVLVGITMRFAVLRRAVDESARQQGMDQVESLVSRSIQVARSLMSQLSHRALYEMGFVPAAEWLAKDIEGLYGLKVTVEDDGQPKPMEQPVRVLLYQCLREALTNAAKHAGVKEACVRIARDGPVLRVIVEDKGVGFDPSAISPRPDSGFGLFSIEERLGPLGGRVEIQSAPGLGTSVVLEVPVEGVGSK